MNADIKQALMQAAQEITLLRRRNEILEAKVQMIELFQVTLNTRPAYPSVGMGEDVVWSINKIIAEAEIES